MRIPCASVVFITVALLIAQAIPANAQTTVTTTGGTANSVPKFSGSATIVNSAITDSSGNIGIGTTSPAGTLDVEGGTAASGNNGANITFTAQSGNGTNKNGGNITLNVGTNTGTGTAGVVTMNGIAGGNGPILVLSSGYLGINDRGDGCCAMEILSDGALATHFYSESNGDFQIHKYGTGSAGGPVFTIKNAGNIGIGTTSPAVSLDVSQKTDALALPVGTTGQRPTGINGMVRYNSTTSNLEAFINGSWVSLSGGVGSVAGTAGRMVCGGTNCSNSTGSTTLNYCPYKGNVKTTASQGNYTIPSGCLSATLTSMYVGGVASTSVSATTLYYIYLWNNSGTWVLDAETTGHVTDTATGIEIKGPSGSPDNTKTLVGMIHTDANKKIYTGGQVVTSGDISTVATWDNRIPTSTRCGFTANRSLTNTVGNVEINSENRCYFMSWGDAAVLTTNQVASTNTSGADCLSVIYPDGSNALLTSVLGIQNTANYQMLVLAPSSYAPTEGYHYTTLYGAVTSGTTCTWVGPGSIYTWVYTVQ
jgi:hypothetical protein